MSDMEKGRIFNPDPTINIRVTPERTQTTVDLAKLNLSKAHYVSQENTAYLIAALAAAESENATLRARVEELEAALDNLLDVTANTAHWAPTKMTSSMIQQRIDEARAALSSRREADRG